MTNATFVGGRFVANGVDIVEELGQAMGLSVVSVNRTMQVLRRQGLVEFRGQRLTIKNWGRLAAVGGFDPSYLYDAE